MSQHESPLDDADWVLLQGCSDPISAQVLVGRLQSDGVPAQVRAFEPIPGLEQNAEVLVPRSWLARARQSLEAERPNDEELTALALGTASAVRGPDGTG